MDTRNYRSLCFFPFACGPSSAPRSTSVSRNSRANLSPLCNQQSLQFTKTRVSMPQRDLGRGDHSGSESNRNFRNSQFCDKADRMRAAAQNLVSRLPYQRERDSLAAAPRRFAGSHRFIDGLSYQHSSVRSRVGFRKLTE